MHLRDRRLPARSGGHDAGPLSRSARRLRRLAARRHAQLLLRRSGLHRGRRDRLALRARPDRLGGRGRRARRRGRRRQRGAVRARAGRSRRPVLGARRPRRLGRPDPLDRPRRAGPGRGRGDRRPGRLPRRRGRRRPRRAAADAARRRGPDPLRGPAPDPGRPAAGADRGLSVARRDRPRRRRLRSARCRTRRLRRGGRPGLAPVGDLRTADRRRHGDRPRRPLADRRRGARRPSPLPSSPPEAP